MCMFLGFFDYCVATTVCECFGRQRCVRRWPCGSEVRGKAEGAKGVLQGPEITTCLGSDQKTALLFTTGNRCTMWGCSDVGVDCAPKLKPIQAL